MSPRNFGVNAPFWDFHVGPNWDIENLVGQPTNPPTHPPTHPPTNHVNDCPPTTSAVPTRKKARAKEGSCPAPNPNPPPHLPVPGPLHRLQGRGPAKHLHFAKLCQARGGQLSPFVFFNKVITAAYSSLRNAIIACVLKKWYDRCCLLDSKLSYIKPHHGKLGAGSIGALEGP